MSYTIYKGRLGYYVFANDIILTYRRGKWGTLNFDSADSQWRWAAADLVSDVQRITDLELLVMTGMSKKDLKERIGEDR